MIIYDYTYYYYHYYYIIIIIIIIIICIISWEICDSSCPFEYPWWSIPNLRLACRVSSPGVSPEKSIGFSYE